MTSRLAERLRSETRALHAEVELSPLMAALLMGRMNRGTYAALLFNLQAIYAVLEPALARHVAHPAIAPLGAAALARGQALHDDLAVFAGAGGVAPIRPASERYVERLREIDALRPELLLAHAYVRYLGDLSGGQILLRIVAKSLGLPPGTGVSFYDFGDPATTAALILSFRAGLDAAQVEDEDAVVVEARLAFEWHRRLFDELAVAHGIAAAAA